MLMLTMLASWWWPQFGYDLANTHLAPGSGAMGSTPVQKWVYTGSSNDWGESGVSVYDVDGDGSTEVLTGFWLGGVDAVDGATGSRVWAANIGDNWNSVPAMADVDGDGTVEVFVSSWGDGALYCLNGTTGAIEWTAPSSATTSEGSPKIADTDGDGVPEVVYGTWGGYLLFVDATSGAVEAEISLAGDANNSPAIANLDGDPALEVVIAGGNVVYCFDGASHATEWSYTMADSAGWASPAIADVDGDGELEVVASGGGVLYVLSSDGSLEWSQTLSSTSNSSPGVAQLDGDGALEIVVGSDSTIYCVDGATHAIEWSHDLGSEVHRGPAIADVDGDGAFEVVVPNRSSTLYCYEGDGTLLWTYAASTTDIHDPAIADIDDDDCLEIIFALASNTDNLVAIDDPSNASGCSPSGVDEGGAFPELLWRGGSLVIYMPKREKVSLKVYDPAGRLISTLFAGALGPGVHTFTPNGLPGVAVAVLGYQGGEKRIKIVSVK